MSSKPPVSPEEIAALLSQTQALERHYESELAVSGCLKARPCDCAARGEAGRAARGEQLLLARRFSASSEQVNEAQLRRFNEAEFEADALGDERGQDKR